MSWFEETPQDSGAKQNGPILVMPPPPPKLSKWELWRRRIFLIEFIFVCFVIGIILTVAPWTAFWSNNSLLTGFPRLQEFLTYDFVRGLISGLGLIDIGLAVSEAVRYH
jgi:4-amino-4-deoxy-L-arabinose transferase-like glycosyltransferase